MSGTWSDPKFRLWREVELGLALSIYLSAVFPNDCRKFADPLAWVFKAAITAAKPAQARLARVDFPS